MLAVILVFVCKAGLNLAGAAMVVNPAPDAAAGWPLLAGCPSLFVIRGAEANAFFSSRLALSGVSCGELMLHAIYQYNHWGQVQKASLATRVVAAVAAVAIFCLQASLSLAMRVSWTADLIIALVFSRFCNMVAFELSPYVDAYMPSS